jgi:hypothetical protein
MNQWYVAAGKYPMRSNLLYFGRGVLSWSDDQLLTNRIESARKTFINYAIKLHMLTRWYLIGFQKAEGRKSMEKSLKRQGEGGCLVLFVTCLIRPNTGKHYYYYYYYYYYRKTKICILDLRFSRQWLRGVRKKPGVSEQYFASIFMIEE